jgi:hypothetical protein
VQKIIYKAFTRVFSGHFLKELTMKNGSMPAGGVFARG